jgi:hypothetical protein
VSRHALITKQYGPLFVRKPSPRDGLRALSVRQPWTSAIAYGDKRTENRGRATHYRGPLALHASLAVDWNAPEHAWTAAGLTPYRPGDPREAWRASLPLGAIIAVAEVVGCHPHWMCIKRDGPLKVNSCMRWGADGQFHWLLASVRPLAEPVPAKGMLGLWTVPEDAERAVRAQLGEDR